jgi:hypothetical protein
LPLRQGVVIDPERRLVFVARPDRSIEAVALRTGETRWRTQAAAQPLGLWHDRLIAQVEADGDRTLRIALLDIASGARMAVNGLTLPPGVRPSIESTRDGRFTALALPGDSDATVVWRFEPGGGRGVRPDTPDALKRPGRGDAAGAPPAQPGPNAGAIRINMNTAAMSPVAPADTPFGAFAVADAPVGLLFLREPVPDLAPDQILSIDGRHVITVRRIADDTSWETYLFTVQERAGNARIGEIRSHEGATRFFVSDAILVYETLPFARRTDTGAIQAPLTIHAFDLAGGKEIWSRDVRDSSSRRTPP